MPQYRKREAAETADHDRTERHLRNVRLKLRTARQQLQTLERQSGLKPDDKHMRVEIARAEQKVRELEETEAELVKELEGEAPPAAESEAESEPGEGAAAP